MSDSLARLAGAYKEVLNTLYAPPTVLDSFCIMPI